MRKKKIKTKICSVCGRELPTDEFYTDKKGRLIAACKECSRKRKRQWYAAKRKKKEVVFKDTVNDRLMERKNGKVRIFWTKYMLERMLRLYQNTLNEDLAIELNVSKKTLIRKAKELGLKKDKEFISGLSRKNCLHMLAMRKRHGGGGRKKCG